MAQIGGIYWVTPAAMLAALFCGIMFSIGHHVFYASLAGTLASSGSYSIAGTSISKQQFHTGVGTTFAFLVKSTLALAVSIAYVQAFWYAARVRKKGEHLSALDTTFSILENALGFLKARVWYKYPLLLSMAIVAWLIPIASIITPATLSVQHAMTVPPVSQLIGVAKLDFTSLDFISPMPVGGPTILNQTAYCYQGPSQLVKRVATAVGARGEVLPIAAPAPNSSWVLEFWAPSMRCNDATEEDRTTIFQNVWDYLNDPERCNESWGYLAWAPSADSIVPFVNDSGTLSLRSNTLTFEAPTSIFVALFPLMFENTIIIPSHVLPGACALYSEQNNSFEPALKFNSGFGGHYFGKDNAKLMQCQFLNISHTANFTYTDGAQTIQLKENDVGDTLIPQECITGPESESNAFDAEDLGIAEAANSSCSTLNADGSPCQFDAALVRILAYQGVVDAFIELIHGSIGLAGPNRTAIVTPHSAVYETILMDSEDLAFIQTWDNSVGGFRDLQTIAGESNGTAFHGLSNNKSVASRGPLQTTLEYLFTNMTLSLMSEQYLHPNYSSPFAPSNSANVTFTTYQNIYVYSTWTLWTAYSLAVAATIFAVSIGLGAMLLNDASYDRNFSTILRISRAATVDEKVLQNESNGSLPLPKRLSQARVVMPSSSFEPEKVQTGGVVEGSMDDEIVAPGAALLQAKLPDYMEIPIPSPELSLLSEGGFDTLLEWNGNNRHNNS